MVATIDTAEQRTSVRRPARRTTVVLLLALAVLALVCMASIMFGSKTLPPGQVWEAVTGHADAYTTTVVESRYPRTALGIVVGLGLAVAGVLMQTVTRNPLAEPGLLGVNTGAAASVVAATAFAGVSGQTQTLLWSLPGALLTGVFVYVIGTLGRGLNPVRLVLGGAVLTAVLSAFIQAVTLSRPQVFDSYRYWVVGALGGHDWDAVRSVLPLAVAGFAVALFLGRGLNIVALGEDSATSLGARPDRVKAVALLTATVLSAAATAAAGPIAFVGLAVPHLARTLLGADVRRQLALSAVLGPILLLAADVIGRLLVRPQELMVGVVTAFAGAPALLIAVRRMRASS
ncbi:FecCD family ABC transporter permease [Streptomyces noursei]|uniref:FecCD family ABC transporter permease n=1 Tax=Streptomyces noursei TaxID=1971 RepID=UPI001678B586|nr:iron ABC transporter permease [Streptomyces noursei]MCZ1020841.1 iron ABC transporter permease [Streptomyces noursei]GGX29316.1 ABC transporter permease [Streptomyces noursei]